MQPEKLEVCFLKGERILCSLHHAGYYQRGKEEVLSVEQLVSKCG